MPGRPPRDPSSSVAAAVTGKKLGRRMESWGGGGGGRRKVRPHVRKAATRAFLTATILIAGVLALFGWLASMP
ncbi:hypothetical protein JHFBIEKO_0222 [Methylobacterium mesophilicum]|jgi:hypothetical protein|nr:hypothetical protein JHFBIEKO_0222 [Methylobacterium mesophilicum]